MIIFPAIDIKNGKVIRLLQGEFDKVTEYGHDPLAMAKQWKMMGAKWIHMVDLDGAQTGSMQNRDVIKQIAQTLKIPVQVGGGIRDEETVNDLLNAGIQRIVLGTKAIENLDFLKALLDQWSDRIAVSLDCQNGFVTTKGWQEVTEIKATDFVKKLEERGLKTLIYTDIARDGMLTGPNFEALEELLSETNIPVIASGGISKLDDIKRLLALESKGIVGAITGKAIYEGTLDLVDALELC